jgi:hypothetical protein
MTQPFININEHGIAFLTQRPTPPKPGQHDYQHKPVQVCVRHDLSIELHGEHFSASAKLTPGEILGLASMLMFLLRDHLEVERGVQ